MEKLGLSCVKIWRMKVIINAFFKAPVVLLLLNFTIISCSNNDGNTAASEISKASGAYELIELNVNPSQDINGDGTVSSNLLDELSCISGTLSLRSNGTYGFNLIGIEVTTIANGQFFIDCAAERNSDSSWNIQNGLVTLFADVTTTPYMLVDDSLTRTVSEDLPGIQSVVYLKQ